MVCRGEYDGSKECEMYGPIEQWDVSQVTDMSYAFSNYVPGNAYYTDWPSVLLETLDLSAWDTGKVTNMSGMFFGATSFHGDGIGAWNTSNVTNMARMFCGATSFRGNGIGAWDISNVTDMSRMFRGATSFRNDGFAYKYVVIETHRIIQQGAMVVFIWLSILVVLIAVSEYLEELLDDGRQLNVCM